MHYQGYELVRAYKERNNKAFAMLFDELHSDLFYFTLSLVKEDQVAEDIVSETFIKLWNHQGEFEDDQKLKSFMLVTARNASLNHIKRQKRQTDQEKAFQYLIAGDHAELFSTEEIRAQVIKALYEEIENLPPKCKDITKMIFFERLSISEIAFNMGISEKTVRAQKDRARELLKAAIYKKGIFIVLPAIFIFCKD